jgi:hypothetical protein
MFDVHDAAVLWPLLVVVAIVIARCFRNSRRLGIIPSKGNLEFDKSTPVKVSKLDSYIEAFPSLGNLDIPKDVEEKDQMIRDKDMYWKLQNIEDHPGE